MPKLGYKQTTEHKHRISVGSSDEKHHMWKGDAVGYQALHIWIRKKLGTPQYCSHCQSTKKKKYEWANLSGKYTRVLDDWIRLCTSCHVKYDGHSQSMLGKHHTVATKLKISNASKRMWKARNNIK